MYKSSAVLQFWYVQPLLRVPHKYRLCSERSGHSVVTAWCVNYVSTLTHSVCTANEEFMLEHFSWYSIHSYNLCVFSLSWHWFPISKHHLISYRRHLLIVWGYKLPHQHEAPSRRFLWGSGRDAPRPLSLRVVCDGG